MTSAETSGSRPLAIGSNLVGIEVLVTALEGKWKLSQNRPAADIAGVISGLAGHGPTSDEARVARWMADRKDLGND